MPQPTPPPASDADLLKGGPEGDPAAPPQPAAALKKVKISGKEVELSEDIAALLDQREQEFAKKLGEQGSQIADLRRAAKQFSQPQAPLAPAQPADPDFENLLYTNPKEFVAQVFRTVEERVVKPQVQGLRQEYAADKSHDRFWDDFYAENKDIKKYKILVQPVLTENSYLLDMPVSEAKGRLADLVRQEALKLVGRPAAQDQTYVESPSGSPAPSASAAPDDGLPRSLSDAIKARRAIKYHRSATQSPRS